MIGDRVRAFLEGFRAALRREELPPPLSTPARPGTGNELLRAIFAPERLPLDPEPEAPSTRGVLAAIFGREALGQDAPEPPRHRTRWLNLLFRPERLDD